jgi:dihydroorotase
MKTLIKNAKTLGKYLGQSSELVDTQILIEDGKISKLASNIDCVPDQEIDAKGMFLSPGLIDPQVHFREPGGEHKEDIESGSKAAAKGGFTTVICMPNTNPASDDPKVLEYIYNKAKKVGITRVLPTAAVSMGLKGREFPNYTALKEAHAIAFTDDGKGVQDDEFMLKAMSEIAKLDLPLLDHSEDEELSAGGSIHEGEVSKKYGIKGIKASSEAAHVKRGCEYSEKTGCHFHVLHISTIESIEHVREAKRKGLKVTAEVSPHHLLLCDEDIKEREQGELDPNFKMNPPLRSKEDRAACHEALLDGTIDVIATDHAPHASNEKANHITKAPFGIIGLATSFPLLYTNFVMTKKMSLEKLIDMMTILPANLFKLPYGTLNVGQSADLTLIDLEAHDTITEDFFHSKSKNSPFYDWKVQGLPKLTMFEGRVVFNEL